MREPERDNGRIQDMLEHAQNIMDFVEGVAFEDFVKDKILYFALVKNLEIIGEAAYPCPWICIGRTGDSLGYGSE